MKYCTIDSQRIITGIFISGEKMASKRGWLPLPPGAAIGDLYKVGITLEDVQEENRLLKAQLQAQAERSDFIEDCIAEMATMVYGGV